MNLDQALKRIAEQDRLIESQHLMITTHQRQIADDRSTINNMAEYIRILEDKLKVPA